MKDHSGPRSSRVWIALRIALYDIRSYWGTAVLLAVTGAAAAAAALPITGAFALT